MQLAQALSDPVASLVERFHAAGQGHVFRFLAELGAEGRARLCAQAAGLDLEALARARERALALAARPQDALEPAPVEVLPEHGGDAAARRRARARGEALLAEGRVAALVVAGGQGTRLGHPGPKGTFPLGPVTARTLFGLQAERLRGLRRRYGRPVPWVLMTSPRTDAETRAWLAREDWLGLDPEDVFFFCQREVPCLDFEGRLILEAPDRLAFAPDGHGGSLPALAGSGVLDALAARGVGRLAYSQVDNPLVRIGDPLLVGLHAERGSEMTCKVVRKRAPDERVGTLAREHGRTRIVEYTEVREPARSRCGPDGELLLWAGAIGAHALDVDFVRRVAADADEALPYHASPKRIPAVDERGRPCNPAVPNGIKLERFVFDALPWARASAALEVRREEEYSPVKNARGGESPATGRRDLDALARRWLAEARLACPPEAGAVELDHAAVDGPGDLRSLGLRDVLEAPDTIRIGWTPPE